MHIPNPLYKRASALVESCRAAGIALYAAESCTGGLVMAALTEIAGSSDVVMQGFVTYSNDAKTSALGVPPELIEAKGAVSESVARAMAEGTIRNASLSPGKDRLAVSITGIAGPGGGSAEKPVGTVHFGVAGDRVSTAHAHHIFEGDRQQVRLAAVETALALLQDAVDRAGQG